jgi:hypothetical protein
MQQVQSRTQLNTQTETEVDKKLLKQQIEAQKNFIPSSYYNIQEKEYQPSTLYSANIPIKIQKNVIFGSSSSSETKSNIGSAIKLNKESNKMEFSKESRNIQSNIKLPLRTFFQIQKQEKFQQEKNLIFRNFPKMLSLLTLRQKSKMKMKL